jgi:hypothetical protein
MRLVPDCVRHAHPVTASSDASLGDVNSWFVARGFELRISDIDYSKKLRQSPEGAAMPVDVHTWVDLWTLDGRMIHPAYGAGPSVGGAAERAKQRWLSEQEGLDLPAPIGDA